ncbi:MAG: Crp/Fnr family transcriptional regulator [Gemmatimonadota bacterium]|nr:Crp/Fnr family transcriptional regulator [Gemmatimonadota bacterium]
MSVDLYPRLRRALARWSDLPNPQWEELASIFRERQVPAGAYLLRPGDEDYDLMFVGEGLLRIYYIGEEGREWNKAFPAEGGFAGPLATALLGEPSRYGIQALEPSRLLAARYADYFELLESHPAFDRLGRRIVEWVLGQRELRERSLLQDGAAERYAEFRARHPELIGRVPQYHVASYLGVTEVTLSRLRGALAERGS